MCSSNNCTTSGCISQNSYFNSSLVFHPIAFSTLNLYVHPDWLFEIYYCIMIACLVCDPSNCLGLRENFCFFRMCISKFVLSPYKTKQNHHHQRQQLKQPLALTSTWPVHRNLVSINNSLKTNSIWLLHDCVDVHVIASFCVLKRVERFIFNLQYIPCHVILNILLDAY